MNFITSCFILNSFFSKTAGRNNISCSLINDEQNKSLFGVSALPRDCPSFILEVCILVQISYQQLHPGNSLWLVCLFVLTCEVHQLFGSEL